MTEISAEYAAQLDTQDELAAFRQRFLVDDPSLIYLDGNSLGRMPLAAAEMVRKATQDQWGSRLVRAWPEGWVGLSRRLGAKIAQLIGADEDEVIVCDSTSVNLFKLVSAAIEYQCMGKSCAPVVVTDDMNFPTDLYVMQGCTKSYGAELRVIESKDGMSPDTDGIVVSMAHGLALLSLTHVAFKSGALHDMQRLTSAAHKMGALALWDLSHSVGAVPLNLRNCDVDLAVGCTYKYLNGGPGSPAFLYVRRDLQQKLENPICGWFGERAPFDFRLKYEPAYDIGRFLAGTPPILSMVGIEAGVDLLLEAGIDRLREKSIRQTEYLISLFDEWLAPLGFTLKSPRVADSRGSHVSIGHPDAWRVDRALIEEMNVIPDFRAPDCIRFGVTPLYTTFTEIREAIERLAQVATEGLHLKYDDERAAVT